MHKPALENVRFLSPSLDSVNDSIIWRAAFSCLHDYNVEYEGHRTIICRFVSNLNLKNYLFYLALILDYKYNTTSYNVRYIHFLR